MNSNEIIFETKRTYVKLPEINTETSIVQGTPHKKNIGSQKMQERVGMKKIGEDKYSITL